MKSLYRDMKKARMKGSEVLSILLRQKWYD